MSDQTVVTLKDYIIAILDEREERIQERFAQLDKALGKAEAAMDKRFASVNEFRSQLADQSRTFVPRREIEATVKNLSSRLTDVVEKQNRSSDQKKGSDVAWAYIISLAAVAISLIALIYKH